MHRTAELLRATAVEEDQLEPAATARRMRAEHLGELVRPHGRDLARDLGGEAERLLRAQPGVGVTAAWEGGASS